MRQRGLTGWIHRIFVENAYYKIFSLVLVTVLHFWVLGDRDSEIAVAAPLRMALPEGMTLVSQGRDEVRVTLSGRWSALQRFNETRDVPPILVDLKGRKAGEVTVPIDASMIRLPSGMRARSFQPSTVTVTLEPRATKRVPITTRMVGSPAAGYTAEAIEVRPTQVAIEGPESLIRRTKSMPTDPIDITGVTETVVRRVELRPESPLIREDLDGPVTVTVPVRSTEIERVISNLRVVAVNTRHRVEIAPPSLTLTVRGPKSVINDIDRSSLLASIDLSKEDAGGAGTFQKQPTIRNLPQGISIVRTFPTDFQVRILPKQEH